MPAQEYKTMVRCIPELVDALTQWVSDPQRITCSDRLFAAGLISPNIRDYVSNPKYTDRDKASRLVASITDRVNRTPSDFEVCFHP